MKRLLISTNVVYLYQSTLCLGSLSQVNRLVQLRNQVSETKVTGVQISPVAKEEPQEA